MKPTKQMIENEKKPSPKLDAWFAELVMEWDMETIGFWCDPLYGWKPSSNIAHAMEGVDHLIKTNENIHVHLLYHNSIKKWRFLIQVDYISWNGTGPEQAKAEDKEKELAITRALLLWAIEKEE